MAQGRNKRGTTLICKFEIRNYLIDAVTGINRRSLKMLHILQEQKVKRVFLQKLIRIFL